MFSGSALNQKSEGRFYERFLEVKMRFGTQGTNQREGLSCKITLVKMLWQVDHDEVYSLPISNIKVKMFNTLNMLDT